MLDIAVDRDSVHAGDDFTSHATSVMLDPAATMRAFFDAIRTMHYLPAITGGEATWIICVSGKEIGVFAQQWPTPKLVAPIERLAKQAFEGNAPRIFFKYWCQKDPDVVFSCIETGCALPSRN